MSKPYRVVAISNRIPQEYYYTYHELFKSVGNHEILILGQERGQYTGLSDKPRILYNAIKNGEIKEDIIIFVDAWDVVFAHNLDVVYETYKSFNSDIVIGAEKNCFPACFKREFDLQPNKTSYKYLNSGVIIGNKDAIFTALEAMDAPNLPVDYFDGRTSTNYHFNDQAYYMDIYLRQPVKISLDKECVIAQNMQDVQEGELDFSNHYIRNIETYSFPLIFHWNGGSKDKWSREPILKHLKLI